MTWKGKFNMAVDDGFVARLDRWRFKRGVPVINRSEAVRQILEERFSSDLGDADGDPREDIGS